MNLKPPVSSHQPKNRVYMPILQPKQPRNAPPIPDRIDLNKFHDRSRDKQLDQLRKVNEQLREREEIYIDKLMKLEEGLENQHKEFIKLQELYTDLFESYKQKQSEISQLQLRFRESERYRDLEKYKEIEKNYLQTSRKLDEFKDYQNDTLTQDKAKQLEVLQEKLDSRQREWSSRQRQWKNKQQELQSRIAGLNDRLSQTNENYERVLQEISFLKSHQKVGSSRLANANKLMAELQEWQKQADAEKENKMKYQYENQFLKSRNRDLEEQRNELQKLLTYKQKEIIKLREEKIKVHRQSSEKMMSKSPSRVRSALKTIPAQPNLPPQHKSSIQSRQLESISSSQNNESLNQYYSFSREKNNDSMQSELPTFPAQLQIDSIISQHRR